MQVINPAHSSAHINLLEIFIIFENRLHKFMFRNFSHVKIAYAIYSQPAFFKARPSLLCVIIDAANTLYWGALYNVIPN